MPPLQRGRKRRADPEDEEPSQSPEPATQRRRTSNQNEEDTEYGDPTTQSDTSLDQMVKKMVRFVLACEYQRRPIRRAEIGEKVLGTAGRQFKAVFNQAQVELRGVFGMEMVELPSKEKLTVAQKRAAQKQSQQSKAPTAWVLQSTLPSEFRDPAIIPPPQVPTSTEESKYIAITTTLVSLIALSGGSLPDAKMERYLRRLDLEDHAPFPGTDYAKTERLFKRMEKEGYVNKVRESTGTGEEDVSWTVGPRGKAEVAVEGIVRVVYGDQDAENEELTRRIGRSLGLGEEVERKRDGGEQKKKRGRNRRAEDDDDDEEGEEQEEEEEDDDDDDDD